MKHTNDTSEVTNNGTAKYITLKKPFFSLLQDIEVLTNDKEVLDSERKRLESEKTEVGLDLMAVAAEKLQLEQKISAIEKEKSDLAAQVSISRVAPFRPKCFSDKFLFFKFFGQSFYSSNLETLFLFFKFSDKVFRQIFGQSFYS
jgi:hypothetical protein